MKQKTSQRDVISGFITTVLSAICAMLLQSINIETTYKDKLVATSVPVLTIFINGIVIYLSNKLILNNLKKRKNKDYEYMVSVINDQNTTDEIRGEVKIKLDKLKKEEINASFQYIQSANKRIRDMDKSFVESLEDISK